MSSAVVVLAFVGLLIVDVVWGSFGSFLIELVALDVGLVAVVGGIAVVPRMWDVPRPPGGGVAAAWRSWMVRWGSVLVAVLVVAEVLFLMRGGD